MAIISEEFKKIIVYFKDNFVDEHWPSKYGIDLNKIGSYEPQETFKFFILSSFFQGGADVNAINNVFKAVGINEIANYGEILNSTSNYKSRCSFLKSHIDFERCNYYKSPNTKKERCQKTDCLVHLIGKKVHMMKSSEMAKLIVSSVLLLNEKWGGDLNNIYREALKIGKTQGKGMAAQFIVNELVWIRSVSKKIANMFCGFMSNPDIERAILAWNNPDVDWTYFVTIDSLVKRTLQRMGLCSKKADYFDCVFVIRKIAKEIKLREILGNRFNDFNPRYIEVAIWMFSRKKDDETQNTDGFCFGKHPNCDKCMINNNCPKIDV